MCCLESKHKTGLAVGGFFALVHLLWSVLVALGIAESLMDFVYGIHFLTNPFTVIEFSLVNALVLVVVAFVCGYVTGWVLSWVGEKCCGGHGKK
ncbi:MAG: hypothetical protein UT63_C0051G0009 [Candidatus Gottesmanbacteria bacterium GW2011_GWC2_39_8]|uniref:Uncharacterized protein n=1 Tax=Candidatus Gottesmanbacteria bacterium GW2011_GWC2_39_8 TaxID=1618450 RepID=A0A0G0T2V5_9BACT|nr:MAG: hypothetical protein UT63_C0051G0009 [Candidatus Gottesmanbacteria bacterium GW2011_GWC2_39_8]